MASTNTVAKTFRSLHKPGNPVLLANVWDAVSANAVAALPDTKALATTSYAIARAAGLADNDLDLETNLRAAKVVASVAQKYNKPLSVDFQDGYGDKLEEGIATLIKLGIVGINLEDANKQTGKLYSIDEAASRVKRAVKAASDNGVPDFVVNARSDALIHGGTIEDTIGRGKAYLAAGAANIFVLGGSTRGGISKAEVIQLTEAFGGKLNVSTKQEPGALTPKDVAAIGVARCSIGPSLQFPAAATIAKGAEAYYANGK